MLPLESFFFLFFFTAPRRSMSSSFAPDPYGRTVVLQARQSKKWHWCIGRTPLAASDGSPYYYPSGKQILPPTSLDCECTSAMRGVSCCVERPMMIEDGEQEPLLGSLRKSRRASQDVRVEPGPPTTSFLPIIVPAHLGPLLFRVTTPLPLIH